MDTTATLNAVLSKLSGKEAELAASAAPSPPFSKGSEAVDADLRNRMIRETAYYRAEARGFTAGYALQDWLQAEADVDRWLLPTEHGPRQA